MNSVFSWKRTFESVFMARSSPPGLCNANIFRGKFVPKRQPYSPYSFKVGLGISRTNADSQWNPVYNAFHRKFCCGNETIRRQFCNVILTRQTCGQRSSRTAESKRRAIGNYFSERICYMLLISKCRGDRDLGLCTILGFAFGEPQVKMFKNFPRLMTHLSIWPLTQFFSILFLSFFISRVANNQLNDL